MKKKSRKPGRKRRAPIVELGFDRDVEISFIEVDGGRLVFKDEKGNVLEPSTVTVGDAYLRPKKPKVLRQLAADPANIVLDTKELLKGQFATLVVDTNCHDFVDFRLCVTSAILILYENRNGRRVGNCYHQADFVFCTNSRQNPERFGWWDVLRRFTESSYYDASGTYGLAVDSDLRDLPNMNSRQSPVWNQHFLPSGFQILYASADAGRESYINKEMRLCHEQAEKRLAQVRTMARVDGIGINLKTDSYLPMYYLSEKGK